MAESVSLVPLMGDGYNSSDDSLHALKQAVVARPIWSPDSSYWYVDYTNGSDSNDGTSWDNALKTVAAAIAKATSAAGDTIYIRNAGSENITVDSEALRLIGVNFPTITGNMSITGDATYLEGIKLHGDISVDARAVAMNHMDITGDVTGSAGNYDAVRFIENTRISGALTIGEATVASNVVVRNTGGIAITVRGNPSSAVGEAILRSVTMIGSTGLYVGGDVNSVYVDRMSSIFADTPFAGDLSAIMLEEGMFVLAEGTLTPTGTEDTIFLAGSMPGPLMFNGAYIDLSAMTSSDTTTIRVYVQIASSGSLKIVKETTFSGEQTEPMAFINLKLPFKYGLKLTVETTVTADMDYEVF